MSKLLKKLSAVFIAAVAVFALAACGETPDNPDGPNTPSAKPLQLWVTTLDEEVDVIKQATAEIWNKEHPEAPVEVTVVPGNSDAFYQKLAAAFATDNGPDMFCISNVEMLKYVNTGVIYDVTKWLEPTKSDYTAGAIEAVTFDGKIMAFPGNMDVMGIYCNNKMFAEAGLDFPQTWDELIDAANKLATKDRYGIIVQTDIQSGYQLFEFYPFLWMCGGDVLDENGKAVFDTDATKKALSFYRELLNAPGTCKKVSNSNTDISPFGTGRTAMQICGSWAVSWLAREYEDVEYTVIPYPTPEKGMTASGVIGGWQYAVSSKGDRPEVAAEYLNWLWNTGVDIPKEAATRSAKVSPRISVIEAAKDYYSAYPFNVFVDSILPLSRIEPKYPAAVVKAAGDALQNAAYSSKSIDDIVADTQKKCEKAVK